MKFIFLFLIILIVLVAGCTKNIDIPDKVECTKDSDCVRAGCSSQLCLHKDKASEIFTTCEYREEYGCLQEFASCGCNNEKCDFSFNEGYEGCMSKIGN